MKRSFVSAACAVLTVVFASELCAQSANEFRRFDINWNVVSYVRQGSTDNLGGTLGFTAHVNDRWGIVADLGVHAPTDFGFDATTYRFGPRITHRSGKRLMVFGQFLAGGVHLNVFDLGIFSPTANGFSMLMGGGVDVGIRHWFAIRVVEGGYSGLHVDGGWSNGARVSTGIVFRFGQ